MRSHHWAISRGAVVLLPVVVLVALTACAAPKTAGFIRQIDDARMSEHELRVHMVELAREVMGRMKARSFDVYAAATDAESRRAALMIAIRTSEMTIDATTHSDPMICLADLWALIVQMRAFMSSDQGSKYIVGQKEEILNGLRVVEEKIFALADELGGPSFAAKARETIETWARENPLTGNLYRPSVAPLTAAAFKAKAKGLFSVAESLDESVSSVATRIEILNDQLPQQIIWRAALLIEDLIGDLDIEGLAQQTHRVMTMVEEAPGAIEIQRDAVLQDINRQRIDTLGAIDVQRELLLAEIDRQRTETLDDLQTTVDDTLAKVLEVRDATFERIDTTLMSTMDRLDGTSESLVEDIDARILSAIDRVFWRFLLIVGLALAGAAAIAGWALRQRPALR